MIHGLSRIGKTETSALNVESGVTKAVTDADISIYQLVSCVQDLVPNMLDASYQNHTIQAAKLVEKSVYSMRSTSLVGHNSN